MGLSNTFADAVNAVLPSRWRLVDLKNASSAPDNATVADPSPIPPSPPPPPPLIPVQSAGETTRYFYLGPDAAITRLRDGHHLFVDPQDETVSTHLIANGIWETWIHNVVCSLISPGDKVIEVGANVGYYTVAMARRVGAGGSVVALEANARLARLVERSVEFNGYRDRVTVVPKAAMDEPGTVNFITSRRNSGGGHSQVLETVFTAETISTAVEAIPLDQLVSGDVDFIRMDAEGSEPLILRGATRLLAKPDVIVCMEWDVLQMASRGPVTGMVDWLTGLGFRFWRIETDSRLTEVRAEEMAMLEACDVLLSRRMPKRR